MSCWPIGPSRFVIKQNESSPKFRTKHLLRSAHVYYQLAAKELANGVCHVLRSRLQRKVTSVVEMYLSRRVIAPERLRTGRQKEWSFLPQTASSGGRFVRKYS